MKAVKKPIPVDVWQMLGHDIEIVSFDLPPQWVIDAASWGVVRRTGLGEWEIHTPEGVMCAYDGDYLVKGVVGELYPVQRGIFEKTYEVLQE